MKEIDRLSISAMRVLAAEAIQKANSGHPGMPIGAASMAYAIWKKMRHNPADPNWYGRDRFILSSGHASMLEYALLHLYGYGVSIEDIKQFRQLGSKTPGHPEYGHTVGVEATTGPLGQGFAMAVGMAMARQHMAAKFNKDGFNVIDGYVYTLMGDGCMMEGITSEAASLAGALKLNCLIAVYDRNKITIEGSTDCTFTEDVGKRFEAYGWEVRELPDGEDVDAIEAALDAAKGRSCPQLIIVNSKIAHGTAKEGMASSHGSPLGDENIRLMKEKLGLADMEPFAVSDEVYQNFKALAERGAEAQREWERTLEAYFAQYPDMKAQWQAYHSPVDGLENLFELCKFEGKVATRAASGTVLNKLAELAPNLIGGSADLAPSNNTELKGIPFISADDFSGRNIHFGIREFAMAAICNGMALFGGMHTFCATFMVFSDYLKPALRLSALMHLPVIYVLTHDSIGVGEDGPTHQPIEHLAALRATPNVNVFRPADGNETVAAYISAMKFDGPTAIALSRQGLPTLAETGMGALKGGYVLRRPEGTPDVILMATGSEVELLYGAADILAEKGYKAQLVSMPCLELFDAQDEEYKESVLPGSVQARVAVEAASDFGWHKYIGFGGKTVSVNTFGASAPAGKLFAMYGFTAENVAAKALEAISGARR